jgi:UDP-glucose 4-epimerase
VNCFNLAVPDRTSVLEIARLVLEALGLDGTTTPFEFTGGSRGWRGDVPFVDLATSRMSALGWRPRMGSGEAVRRSIREIVGQFKAGHGKE